MKISTVFFILFSISFLPFLDAQSAAQKIKIIDFNFVLQQLSIEVDKNNGELKEAYILQKKLGEKMVEKFQLEFYIINRRFQGGCMSKEQADFYTEYLKTLEKRVLDFEKNSNEMLSNKKMDLERSIFNFSKKKIQEIGKTEGAIILDRQFILYRNDATEDLTQKLMNYIHQDTEYSLWLNEIKIEIGLLEKIQNLVIDSKPIFPEHEYEWAKKKIKN